MLNPFKKNSLLLFAIVKKLYRQNKIEKIQNFCFKPLYFADFDTVY